MRQWELVQEPAPADRNLAVDMIHHLGQASFSDAVLARINSYLPAGSCSMYRIWPDRPPRLLFSHSFRRPDVTLSCFSAYDRQGLYRSDPSFVRVRPERLALLHSTLDDFPNPLHRELVYRRNCVRERLSLARKEPDGSVTSLNLYTHDDHTGYRDSHIASFRQLAPLLFTGVERHVQLRPDQPPQDADDRRTRLQALNAQLTERELDICERILQGMTYDGMAGELGLSRATIITYRNRAFARLGIHFKSQLFAMVASSHSTCTQANASR